MNCRQWGREVLPRTEGDPLAPGLSACASLIIEGCHSCSIVRLNSERKTVDSLTSAGVPDGSPAVSVHSWATVSPVKTKFPAPKNAREHPPPGLRLLSTLFKNMPLAHGETFTSLETEV